MKKYYHIKIFIFLAGISACLFSACTKDALNQKSDIRLTVASTINDYQQLLDGIGSYDAIVPSYKSLGTYMSDDVSLNDNSYNSFNNDILVQKIYTWDKQLFSSSNSIKEWDDQYRVILNTNIVLEGIANIPVTSLNKAAWDNVKGSALMIRGLMFLDLANYWAPPYKAATASTDLGIVLKLSQDINAKAVRSTVSATYDQIISDLKQAVQYLPDNSAANSRIVKVRPTKAAAYGLLARTYLTMQDYKNVALYADSALQSYSALINYNDIDTTSSIHFQNYNSEIVFNAGDNGGSGSYYSYYAVDSTLVKSYDNNDLRLALFFYEQNGEYSWLGDYNNYSFTGLANDEVYLMRAEANARLGNRAKAMADLNALLSTRWVTGTYVPKTASSTQAALDTILTERRKELVFRGTRWSDLRRLNLDPQHAKSLSRTVNGKNYTLPANDSRYTLQIPPYVISFNGIQQNP